MGLTMAERRAVTRQMARRYQGASKAEKGRLLDELQKLPAGSGGVSVAGSGGASGAAP